MEARDRYDCIECGHMNCVTVIRNAGFCNTDGCVVNNPIQFVYYPNWKKPKTSRAGREIWWDAFVHENTTASSPGPK